MEFFIAVFFLLFYYVRPQDWVPGLIGVNIIKPIIAVWIAGLLVNRSRESPLPGLLRTPHDWIMLSYMMYIVWNAQDSMDTFKAFLPLVAFYVLTVQSLNTWPRILDYLKWWCVVLTVLAILGVLIPFGIDPTAGKDYYDQTGRLRLGTWMHENPNALGHSVVVAIPMAYFLFFWRGTAIRRLLVFPLIAGLAYWCVFLTASKGAFLVGGILVASVFVVGRPRIIQICAIIAVLTLGVGALSYLPRMSQMNDLSSDEGVQGRLMAWEMARGVTLTNPTGVGWKQFIALIDWQEGDRIIRDMPISTHSSYVQIGADLGKYGLFLYLAGFWCVLHTLLKFRPANEMEDRCSRIIWVLLLASLVSGWMINRQYHTENFLLVAAAAALHRLAKSREQGLLGAGAPEPAETGTSDSLTATEPPGSLPLPGDPGVVPVFSTRTDADAKPVKPLWNRFGLVDLAVCIGLTWLTFWFWDYILRNL